MDDPLHEPRDAALLSLPTPLAVDWRALLRLEGMRPLARALAGSLQARYPGAEIVWAHADGEVQSTGAGALVEPDILPVPVGGGWRPLGDGAGMLTLAAQPDGAFAAVVADPWTDACALDLPPWADEVAPLVHNALEMERLRASMSRLERSQRLQRALYEIADMAGSDLDMPTMLAELHRIVGGLMSAENFFIALYESASDSIRFIYFADTAEDEWGASEMVERMADIEGSLTWHLIRGNRALRGAPDDLRRQVQGPLNVIGPPAVDWLGVPILSEGQVRAVLVVQSYVHGGLYGEAEQSLLSYVGSHIITAIDRKRAYAQLEQRTHELGEEIAVREQVERRLQHQATHDSLTGLPNRDALLDHLERAFACHRRDPARRFAVLFMDLDRFKVINDSAGHLSGDELLKAVAARFSSALRAPDIVARLGGDEFAVLMHDVESDEAPARLAQRLIDSLREPVHVRGREFFTSVSIGIVLASGAYTAAGDMLRDADIAMYRAKEGERGRFELFDEALHRRALELLALESDLQLAVARGECEPYFQPLVRLHDGETIGYEALMRWNHPQRGVLAAGTFIEVAEASGVLEALDWQLYESVCRAIPTLLAPGQYVNLNVSPRHFVGGDLDVRLLELLRTHGVRPEQIRIEITEGALVEQPERVRTCLDRLRDAGVYAALDDFGSGYSSMSYLHRFRFQTIKLDRSFVVDLAPGGAPVASAVTQAVVGLAEALGLEVIAEGVETEAQRAALGSLGCVLGQGYLFGRPAPLASVRGTAAAVAGDAGTG